MLYTKNSEDGLTLIEAVIASAIMAIAFIGVYSTIIFSHRLMSNSIKRQHMQIVADQILEVIEYDVANIDQYANLSLAVCTAPGGGATLAYELRPYEWCQRLEGEVGVAVTGDTRSVDVTTLADGRKVVHILLESGGGIVQVVMKRVFSD